MSETKKGRGKRPMIPVIRITNPFNPREFVREEVLWARKKTLAAYFPVVESAPVVVSINGKIVPTEQFGMTYLDKTDNVVVCPVPTGGGGGKQVLAVVAMIAVAVAAPQLAAAYGGGLATALDVSIPVAKGLIMAGTTMAGSMLVNAVFAPPRPTTSSSEKTSSSYGIEGSKDTSLEGIPVPVNYGEFLMGGNILGLYVDNVADDNQILYMLVSAGEGPVGSITNIQINDNPIADYGTSIEVQTRLGLPNQAAIPWFSDVVVPQAKNQKLTTDWTYHTTTTGVDKLRLDFVAPSGLFSIDTKSGATQYQAVSLEAEYRPAGDTTASWSPFLATDQVADWSEATASAGAGGTVWHDSKGSAITDPDTLAYLNDNSPVHDIDGQGAGVQVRVPVYAAGMSISASNRSAVRRSFSSGRLDNQKYEVRVRRTTAKSTDANVVDEVYLSDVNEIVLQELSYPNTALVGLKITLGSQISGIPKVSFRHGGRLIQVYGLATTGATSPTWYATASKNPAWIVWDMLTNKRFGGAMATSRLDFTAFKEWAAYCDQEGYEWNGPLDTEMNVWDACQLVLRVGHAQLVNVGTRYTVVVEKPADPVMMFSVANMIEGSYKETWLGTSDRANEIDVTFFDRNDSYKQRTVKVYDPAAVTAGAKQRSSAITLYGVTDYETAYKEGQFQLNLNRHILRTVDFSAPLEAVACSVGDLIYIQHDMTEWAQAGRFEASSSVSVVQLDRPVTMAAGKQYKLLAMHDAVQRTNGSVLSVAGTSLFLQGFNGSMPVKRIQVNGRDLRVAGTFDQGGGYGVIVDDAAGIAPGQTYTLWDTDVLEEYNVVNEPGAHTALTLQSPMTFAPVQYANWMFGESDKVKQAFRVKAVTGTHDYKRDISAIEYKPEVYDFSRYGPNVPVLPPKDGVIGPVHGLVLYEETYVSGSTIVSSLVASWAAPIAGLYAGADVYVQRNGGPLAKLVDARNVKSAVIDAAKGEVITVKVQAYDIFGKRSQFEQAPSAAYMVIGEVPGIQVGGVTGAGFTWSGRDCKINWRYNSTTHSYEFGSEPTGADAGALDPHFKDYEIRVYESDGTTLRRTEYTTDNNYVYIYDKNFADGATRHLVFEVRMRDIFNNIGTAAVLDAYNPPPSILTANATATFQSATIAYAHSGDPDFAGAQVFVSDHASDLSDLTTPLAQSMMVYEGPDSSMTVPDLMFNRSYYYRIAPFDAFGKTELTPTAVMSFKTSYFNVDTIKDEMLEVNKFAKTIDPVGIVDTLPDPATWERPQVVFLTTDSKLYRLDGGAWVATVKSSDIDGQLNSQQIADAAINTAKFAQGIAPVGVVDALPAAAGYTGPQVVFLTTDGKLYRLKAGVWTSAIPAADVTGQLTDAQLSQIAASKIAGQLTDAQLAQISAAKVAGQLTDAQIAGIAAAKLTGTVTAAQIAAAAIDTTKFANGIQPISIVSALPAVAGYTGPSVVFLNTDGKLYRLVGGAWTTSVAATDMTGSITSTQITDGAISTPKLAAGSITTAKLAAGAVTANEIAADTITSGKIAAGAITADELAANAVTTGKLAAGAVTANEIAANAVTTAKLTAAAVTANELAANSVTTAKINAGAVTTATLAAGAVTANEIAANAVTTAKISAGAVVTASLAANAVTANELAANAVTAAKINAGAVTANAVAANAITAGAIAANAVTAGTIAAGAVSTNELAANAITTAKISAGAVTANTIAANAVTANAIAAGAVTANAISANAVTAGAIAANAVTAGTIAAGAVTATQIAANTITASQLATSQLLTVSAQIGDGLISNAKIGNAEVNTIKIAGNSVTVPSVLQGGAINGIGQGQLIYAGQITLYFPDSVSLVMMASWNALGRGASNTRIEVHDSDWTVMAAEDSNLDGYWLSHATSNKVTLGAGYHTFTVYFGNTYGGTTDVGSWAITFLGVMR